MRKPDLGKNKKIRAFGILLAGICFLGLTAQPVYAAVEPDYSQEITPEMEAEGITGFPDGSEDQAVSSRILITDQIFYDQAKMMYVYTTDEGELYANVLDGMMTSTAVTIETEDKLTYNVYKDNAVYKNPNQDGTVTEPGSYSVIAGKKGAEEKVFSFRVIGLSINEPNSYELPNTCVATSVILDGESVLTNNRVIDLSEEGYYTISYQCVRNRLEYELSFNVDRTPPKLTFDGVKKGKARGPVTINGWQEGETLSITLNGTEISSKTRLTQPGEYGVKITDEAGNSRFYSFYILFYLNVGGISFGAIVLLGIAALGIYLYVARKRLRIR